MKIYNNDAGNIFTDIAIITANFAKVEL